MKIAVIALVLTFAGWGNAMGQSSSVETIRTTGLDVMQVALDREAPVIRYYELPTGEKILGESGEAKPIIRFCAVSEGKNHDSTENEARVEYTGRYTVGSAIYSGQLFWKGGHAADFMMMFAMSGNRINVTCRLAREVPGFQLLSVETPPMISVTAGEEAKLVIPTQSGRLVDVEKSQPMVHEISASWFDPARLAMVQDDQALGILSVNSLDDNLFSAVTDDSPHKGTLWARFVLRPEASKPEYQFLMQPSSTCSISILGKQGKKAPTWIDAAKFVRGTISAHTNPLYTSSFIYKIFCDSPGASQYTTFDDCLKLIKEINALTGGTRQIVYLVGWQHNGHDTGYPDVFKVNKRLGGLEGLKELIQEAKQYNAVVSFHDNYDDAYMDSPAWDEDYIALGPDGKLRKGGVWAGGQSYILSPYKYALGPARERIEKTVETYPIKDTIHIDVLSAVPSRYDFNPKTPAGAQKNLEGKYSIIEQFRKYGIDVTSEGFTSCFVGKISYFWHLMHKTTPVFSSEEPIPLVPMIYHAKASSADDVKTDEDILRALLYGITMSDDFTKSTSPDYICDMFYLVSQPWMKLADREMTNYERPGDTERVEYGDSSYVEVNLKKNTYKVVVDGSTIGQDFAATIPLDKKMLAVYSRSGGNVSFTTPTGWDVHDAKAYSINPDGSHTREVLVVEGRTLTVETKPHVPYRVFVP